jgi:hypothetical protein
MFYILSDKNDNLIISKISRPHYYALNNQKSLVKCSDGMFTSTYWCKIYKSNIELSCQPLLDPPHYIRSIILDHSDNNIMEVIYTNRYVRNNIILGCRYYLGDPRTIIKLNIEVDEKYIDNICAIGDVKFLEWWKNSGLPLKYTTNSMDNASHNGHINVLDWWLKSGLKLKYTNSALDNVLSSKIDVIMWWLNSDLELKISDERINMVYKIFQKILKKI